MNKELFIKWNDYDENGRPSKGGVFKITVSGTEFTYEIVSGSSINTDELIGFLWFWPELDDVRKLASSLTRQGPWRVESHQGMSGCTDWWIEYPDNFGIVRETKSIIHNSMNDKANIKIECWIKDLFDVLWYFKENNIFKSSFEDAGSFGFIDITEKVISRREFFNSHSFMPHEGYECVDEEKLYE